MGTRQGQLKGEQQRKVHAIEVSLEYILYTHM